MKSKNNEAPYCVAFAIFFSFHVKKSIR